MVKLFPDSLSQDIRSTPKLSAEVKVYDALAAQLAPLPGPEWNVFYRVAWLSKSDRGASDGEADFVIAHPACGLIFLEVKGGRIQYDAHSQTWESRDRTGVTHTIKDAFEQAKVSKHTLLRKLKDHPALGPRFIPAAHAVCFPDVLKGNVALSPAAPLEIVIDSADMPNLPARLEAISSHARGERNRESVSPGSMSALRTILARSFKLHYPSLSMAMSEEEQSMLRLTIQQYELLHQLSRNRRFTIIGGAGTGKTMLALEKAKRLAAEGFRTLFTCYNLPLSAYLQRTTRNTPNLTIAGFHGFCRDSAKAQNIALPGNATGKPLPQEHWDQALPNALLAALDKGLSRFDAIVVDEGQDFHETYWDVLQLCLTDPASGILYAFHDPAQAIYNQPSGFLESLPSYRLGRNLRNTRSIHQFSERFYPEKVPISAGPEGRPVEIKPLRNNQSRIAALDELLTPIIRQQGVKPEDIAILLGRRPDRLDLSDMDSIAGCKITSGERQTPGCITVETVHRFKGLEKSIVILTGLDGMYPTSAGNVLYIGITRARSHLIVLETQEILTRYGFTEPQIGAEEIESPAKERH